MSRSPLQELAIAIRDRRAALGLAQGDLAQHGGPSLVTVGQLERGQIARPQPATLARIDAALKWGPGTSASILRGDARGTVEPAEAAPTQLKVVADQIVANPVVAAIEADPYLLPEAKAHFLNQYDLLRRVTRADISDAAKSVAVELDLDAEHSAPRAAREGVTLRELGQDEEPL